MTALFRKLPAFKGKNRLAGLLFNKTLQTAKDVLVDGRYGCSYLLPNLVENVSREIFINGIYEQATSDLIAERSPQNGVFLDLGANIGAISVPLHKQRPGLRIIGVEAAPWLFSYLQQNFDRNGLDSRSLVNKALFYEDDRDIDFFAPDLKFGKGSLSPTYTDKATKVRTVTLDTLIAQLQLPRVDLIKIDVEGHEYNVFRGAGLLLGRADAPDILFEFEDWAENAAQLSPGTAQTYLLSKGYALFRVSDGSRLESMPQAISKGSTMLLATKKNK